MLYTPLRIHNTYYIYISILSPVNGVLIVFLRILETCEKTRLWKFPTLRNNSTAICREGERYYRDNNNRMQFEGW